MNGKNLFQTLMVLVLLAVASANLGSTAATTISNGKEVVFAADRLEDAIRSAINKPTGPIYIEDLNDITILHANLSEIRDLTGLEYWRNLQELDLGNNQIVDVSPLSALTNLQTLELVNNRITDVSPLSALTNLQTLGLGGNQITDVSPLAALTNLQDLNLRGNQITDVSPLAGLKCKLHI